MSLSPLQSMAALRAIADELRPHILEVLSRLKALGIERIVLATGDRREVADAVAASLPIDAVRSELTPDQKVMVVLSERKIGPVMMVGDGVNGAPALAAADIGIAMGVKGAAASAEAADAVLLVDRLDQLPVAVAIAQRSMAIARQSVFGGLGLSFAAMIAAALGHLIPVEGAMLQEFIDVAAILNALRALGDPFGARTQGGFARHGPDAGKRGDEVNELKRLSPEIVRGNELEFRHLDHPCQGRLATDPSTRQEGCV